MALVDTFGTGAGASRLLMMQVRLSFRPEWPQFNYKTSAKYEIVKGKVEDFPTIFES